MQKGKPDYSAIRNLYYWHRYNFATAQGSDWFVEFTTFEKNLV